jgi:hypothetical protein
MMGETVIAWRNAWIEEQDIMQRLCKDLITEFIMRKKITDMKCNLIIFPISYKFDDIKQKCFV